MAERVSAYGRPAFLNPATTTPLPEQPDMANETRRRVLAQSASARWDRRRGRPHDDDDERRRLSRQKELRRRKYAVTLRASPMQRPRLEATPEELAAAAAEGGDRLGESCNERWLSSREWRRAANPQRYSASDLPLSSLDADSLGASHFRFNRPPLLQRHSIQAGAGEPLLPGRPGADEEDKREKIRRLMERTRRRGEPEPSDDDDWILNRELQERLRKLQRTMAKLRISIPEDDGSQMIETRLEEVRAMCKQVVRAEYFFSLLPKAQQELVLRLEETHPDDFKKERRTNWKKIDLFRFAGRMAHIISKASQARRRYMQPSQAETGGVPSQVTKQKELNRRASSSRDNKDYYLCSISKELRNSLITRPEFRTKKDIKRIIWLLRATKAFTHLFPAEMEEMCALHVGYEKYDDGRILAYQDKAPEKFYYVIGGKINRIRQYKLTLGEVNKSLGFVTKAMTTDPEEMENEILRDSFLVAKGLVEVLVLQKWAYFLLLKSTSGPPLDFLRKIDIFQEFPCELFIHNHDAIDMRYFGPNKMVVRDSNRTPWLHIVKSGFVKVVRHQHVYDNMRNQQVVVAKSHKIGQGRRTSHAGAMMGLSARQRQMKENSFSSLPEITSPPSSVVNPFGLKRSRTILPILSKKLKHKSVNGDQGGLPQLDSDGSNPPMDIEVIVEDDEDVLSEPPAANGYSDTADIANRLPQLPPQEESPLLLNAGLAVPSGKKNTHFKSTDSDQISETTSEVKILASRPKVTSASNAFQLDLKIPLVFEDFGDRDFVQRTFLTRERTELSAVLSGKKSQAQLERPTYVQLDTLRPGDVFGFKDIEKYRPREKGDSGLDHLGATLASEDVGLTLISDGAEIIRISKRFFVANAENNTMLKVETLYKDYMNEESAKELLRDQYTWNQFKHLLIGRTINDHSRKLKSLRSSTGSHPSHMK